MTTEEFIEFLTDFCSLIADMFGDNCEVVLSDIDNEERTVLAIFNGHVSGREVGSPMLDIVKQRIENSADGYFINYDMRETLKKNIKSSTISTEFNGRNFAICINYDCEDITKINKTIQSFLTMADSKEEHQSFDYADDNIIKNSIENIVTNIGKPMSMMNKQDRLEVISKLNQMGILKMQKSIPENAKIMGISRYTIYNYMKELGIS